jgi:hypothetical protein
VTRKLIAIDDLGRQRAALVVERTWRHNDARDCREYGYRIVEQDGCDFGSCTFMFALPVGRSVGLPLAAVWEVAQ